MVEHYKEVSEDRSGICGILPAAIPDKLIDLWDMQEDTGKEHVIAFGSYNSEVVTSSIYEGEEDRVKYMTTLRALSDIPNEADNIGIIHTHPKGEETLEFELSPGDMVSHATRVEDINGYTTSLVITGTETGARLFGIESENDPEHITAVRYRLEALKGRLESDRVQVSELYEILKQMAEELEKTGEWCYNEIDWEKGG